MRIGKVQCHGSILFLLAVRDLCDYATELLSSRDKSALTSVREVLRSERHERLEDEIGCVCCEHLDEALVAEGRLVQAAAT